jgi:hypothetical protein
LATPEAQSSRLAISSQEQRNAHHTYIQLSILEFSNKKWIILAFDLYLDLGDVGFAILYYFIITMV